MSRLRNLADLGPRQVRQISICLGGFHPADPLADERPDFRLLGGAAGAQLHHGGDPLAPLLVRQPDDGAVLTPGAA